MAKPKAGHKRNGQFKRGNTVGRKAHKKGTARKKGARRTAAKRRAAAHGHVTVTYKGSPAALHRAGVLLGKKGGAVTAARRRRKR